VLEAYKKTCMPHAQFKHCSLPTLQISLGIVALFEEIYYEVLILTVFSNIREDVHCTIPLFQLSVRCEKCVAARHYAVICKQLLNANDINRVRWVVLDLLQDGACTDFFENFSENSLKGYLSNATTFNPPLFSLVDTFKGTIRGNFPLLRALLNLLKGKSRL
jgi:hypothetical protein